MLPPLPRGLEISYQNLAKLSSEPPVNFINFVKSDNSYAHSPSNSQHAMQAIWVFKSPKSDRNHRFFSLKIFTHAQ